MYTLQELDGTGTGQPSSNDLEAPSSLQSLDKSPVAREMRAVYFKTMICGVVALSVVIFTVFAIYWGAVYSIRRSSIRFRAGSCGLIGNGVVQALSAANPGTAGVSSRVVPATEIPGGIAQLEDGCRCIRFRDGSWYVFVPPVDSSDFHPTSKDFDGGLIGQGIVQALSAANPGMAGLSWRIVPSTEFPGGIVQLEDAILREETWDGVTMQPPIVPVASAATFVGLIYLFILSLRPLVPSFHGVLLTCQKTQFFVVIISTGARAAAGMDTRLSVGSLVTVHLAASVTSYFFLRRVFQHPFDRRSRFGNGGLVIFWMLNWIGMLVCGLALEAMTTLITVRFVPFFLIFCECLRAHLPDTRLAACLPLRLRVPSLESFKSGEDSCVWNEERM
ncbi:DUF3533 domain-containing protein [Mycena venus]|uniref:DUF3533 domain-containing protein n=1 Tax=Mycena venus TaxID=2733690 RepID=A0A8H6Y119_9AGAR|nr:DUF3533 domain-containing protein [Mycena venus]